MAADGLIEWWGHRSDMYRVLQQALIFVLPTYHNEGVPKVLLEASAVGRAVIASDIPGCRVIVEHEVTGLLVPPRDADALAGAIARLLDDPVLRNSFARAARARVVERFEARESIGLTLASYRRAVCGTVTQEHPLAAAPAQEDA